MGRGRAAVARGEVDLGFETDNVSYLKDVTARRGGGDREGSGTTKKRAVLTGMAAIGTDEQLATAKKTGQGNDLMRVIVMDAAGARARVRI